MTTMDLIVTLEVLRRAVAPATGWTVESAVELLRRTFDLADPSLMPGIVGFVGEYARLNREVPAALLEHMASSDISIRVSLTSLAR